MRCALSWFLRSEWERHIHDRDDGNMSHACAAALEEYRYHLATCPLCLSHIREMESALAYGMLQEEMMGDKLTWVIKHLIEQAAANVDQGRHYVLPNELRIDLMIDNAGAIHLLLSRQGRYPSEMEWGIVLKHWPDHALSVEPERVERGDRCYLKAVWCEPAEPVQMFFDQSQDAIQADP